VSKIVIMIVDCNALARFGLKQMLSGQDIFETHSIMECDPVSGGSPVIARIEAHLPDVVVIDIDYPSLAGLELIRKVVRRCPGTKVVALSANPYVSDSEMFEVIKSGACAYVRSKHCTSEQCIEIIRRAACGEYPVNDLMTSHPRLADRVTRQFQGLSALGKPTDETASRLTGRELHVLELIANGASNKQIADALGVSDQTIKNHVSHILHKTNANARAHAVFLAIRDGLIAVSPPEDAGAPSVERQSKADQTAVRSPFGATANDCRDFARPGKVAVLVPAAR